MGVDVALFTFSLFKMKLVFIILKLFSIAVAEEMEEMPELEIEGTKKAANCRMKAERGDHVSIHFVGSVKDTGKQFDATHHIEPFNFILGDNAIMPGLDQGLIGMCATESRKLTVPHHLAICDLDGHVPCGEDLVFDVELLNIR